MPISFDNIAIFSAGGMLGYLARTFIDHRLAKSRTEYDRKIKGFNQAASMFRTRVFAELKGIYPTTQYWDMNTFQRFPQSITEIESAATEFRFFVTSKGAFDEAIREYCNYCKHVTWNNFTAWYRYPTTRKPEESDPKEKYEHLVKTILSHAEEK